MESHLEKLNGKMSKTSQRLAGLQLQVQLSRLAAKSDIKHPTLYC